MDRGLACRINDNKVVVNFLKENVFSYFEFPRTIISDGGKYFCNRIFEALMKNTTSIIGYSSLITTD